MKLQQQKGRRSSEGKTVVGPSASIENDHDDHDGVSDEENALLVPQKRQQQQQNHERSSSSSSSSANLEEDHEYDEGYDDDDDDGVDLESNKSLASSETMTIFLLRSLVLFVLVISTALVSAGAMAITRHSEYERFQQSYFNSVDSLFDSVGHSLYTTLGAIDTFVVDMVSFAASHHHTDSETTSWPMVKLPNYAVRMAKIRARANIACVNQYNLIPVHQRSQWENWAYQNDDWVQDGLRIQQQDMNFHGGSGGGATITGSNDSHQSTTKTTEVGVGLDSLSSHHILGPDGKPYPYEANRTEPYLASWQSSPIMASGSAYNWEFSNFYSNPEYRTEAVDHRKVVLLEVYNVPTTSADNNNGTTEDQEVVSKATVEYIQSLDPDRNVTEPLSDILYPITLDAADSIQATSSDSSPVVGFLLATVFWSDLIKHVLPIHTAAVTFVFANACGQSFSYRVDGPDVTFMGPGDLHDPMYDHLKQETSFQELALQSSSAVGKIYTGLPLSDKGCPFRLTVYPTKDYEDMFVTSNPFLYAANIVAVFAVMLGLFCCYDSLVERRQKIYTQTVKESTQQTTMLERMVQERTQTLSQANQRLEDLNEKLAASSVAQLHTFACMSHEIRTPLNCIIGLSGLLQDTELNPQQTESLQMIVSSSDLLLAVVNDILDYSKLESGKMEVDVRNSPLQECLNSVIFAMETKAKERNIRLETKFDSTVGTSLQTDSRRLKQILFNLLGNAIKFGDAGSSVVLALSLGEPLEAPEEANTNFYSPSRDPSSDQSSIPNNNINSSRSNLKGPCLRFSVMNWGNGICQEDMKTIFKPFKQSFSGINAGGTGLGLAITTKLTHALGGRIAVESKQGSWVKFSVEFPSQVTKPKKLSGATVALVCKSKVVVDQMRKVFTESGVSFFSVGSMTEIAKQQPSKGGMGPKRNLLCLIDDDLYHESIKRDVLNLQQQYHHVSLTTFGTRRYGVDGPPHIRSLTKTLPSFLLEHLESQAQKSAPVAPGSTEPVRNGVEPLAYRDFRVLIAEDNILNQKVMMRMLKRIGLHNIDIVDNGKKAVDLEASKTFDVVLLDMHMPEMDGIEACEHIVRRHLSNRTKTPPKIVFVTAHTQVEVQGVCCKAGASGVMSKPFKRNDIEKLFSDMHDTIQAERSLHDDTEQSYGTFLNNGMGTAIAT